MSICETCKGKGYIETAVYHHPTLPDGTERIEECDECKHLAIDEAVNILMDYHLRPHFFLKDTESDIDDEIYSHLHEGVKNAVVLTMAEFKK